MGAYSDNGTLTLQVLNSGDRRTDTGIISDLTSVKRNIDITTDEDLLALKLSVGEVFDGLFGLKFKVERSRGSSAKSKSRGGGGEGRNGGKGKKCNGGVEELHD